MKRFFVIALLLAGASLPGFGSPTDEVKKVAILETVDREEAVGYGVKLMLRSNLSMAVTNTPGYEGYDRVDISSIMGEQSFQRTGMVNDDQIKRLGEMTGAAYILVAEVAKIDERNIFITAKILDVETAKLEKTTNLQTNIVAEELQTACRRLAEDLFGTTTPEPDTSEEEYGAAADVDTHPGESEAVFYLPGGFLPEKLENANNEISVYLDKQLVGTGSFVEGFYIKLENQTPKKHELKIEAKRLKSYKLAVDMAKKRYYEFSLHEQKNVYENANMSGMSGMPGAAPQRSGGGGFLKKLGNALLSSDNQSNGTTTTFSYVIVLKKSY